MIFLAQQMMNPKDSLSADSQRHFSIAA